ncbi:MAG: ABC transporter permease [Defluviitaleaceae bacterium]|nr:ABC transporter permease [Defluviitaleaceae bacterium]
MAVLQFISSNSAIIQGAVSLGLIFSIMSIGVFITFRVLQMPDLTVEGSLLLGAAMTARLISQDVNPFAATLAAILVGCAAGFASGFLHTMFKIPSILAGILTMVSSYSIAIRIMGTSNIPLLPRRVVSIFTFLQELEGMERAYAVLIVSFAVVLIVCCLVYCFMGTEFGSALRATGNNQQMVRAQGINTNIMIIACLMLSNGLVGLAGSILAQYQGFASVDMGAGTIVYGLAALIIAEVLFPVRRFWTRLISIVIGSIIYRLVIAYALSVDFMPSTDLRLVTATLVAFALVLPLIREKIVKMFKKLYKRGAA